MRWRTQPNHSPLLQLTRPALDRLLAENTARRQSPRLDAIKADDDGHVRKNYAPCNYALAFNAATVVESTEVLVPESLNQRKKTENARLNIHPVRTCAVAILCLTKVKSRGLSVEGKFELAAKEIELAKTVR